jgi:hypothetical protein
MGWVFPRASRRAALEWWARKGLLGATAVHPYVTEWNTASTKSRAN